MRMASFSDLTTTARESSTTRKQANRRDMVGGRNSKQRIESSGNGEAKRRNSKQRIESNGNGEAKRRNWEWMRAAGMETHHKLVCIYRL